VHAADEHNAFGISLGRAFLGGFEVARHQRVSPWGEFFGSYEIPRMAGFRGNAVQAIDEMGTPYVDGALISMGFGEWQR
jgi:hypothetical protein